MEEMVRNRMLDELAVPPAAGGGTGAGGGGGGSLASASASNLLDVAETASEAWSMDVLASDSESLRSVSPDGKILSLPVLGLCGIKFCSGATVFQARRAKRLQSKILL